MVAIVSPMSKPWVQFAARFFLSVFLRARAINFAEVHGLGPQNNVKNKQARPSLMTNALSALVWMCLSSVPFRRRCADMHMSAHYPRKGTDEGHIHPRPHVPSIGVGRAQYCIVHLAAMDRVHGGMEDYTTLGTSTRSEKKRLDKYRMY